MWKKLLEEDSEYTTSDAVDNIKYLAKKSEEGRRWLEKSAKDAGLTNKDIEAATAYGGKVGSGTEYEPKMTDVDKEMAVKAAKKEGRMEGHKEGHKEGRMEGRMEGRKEGRMEGAAGGAGAALAAGAGALAIRKWLKKKKAEKAAKKKTDKKKAA